MKKLYFLLILSSLSLSVSFAQSAATVYGKVTKEGGKSMKDVNIIIFGEAGVGTTSDESGLYTINVPAGVPVSLVFTHVGFKDNIRKFVLEEGKYYRVDPVMKEKTLDSIVITDTRRREEFIITIPIEQIAYIPDPSGDPIVAALKQMGAVSNNELSTQYSVRGGNFDENLVYVNDFEVYRPLFVRSGQQEGLPFPNFNLVSSLAFSAGGFDAKYGDKLSSVLDIKYKNPKEFGASLALSLLGASFHVEGSSKEQKFGYLLGVRYKTNQYLLNSLETSGEYRPSFVDVQSLLNFKLSKKLKLEVLGNFSSNAYNFYPENRVTSTGLVNSVIRLEVFFEGQEIDKFNTGMLGLSLNQKINNNLNFKWMASGYRADESESFDIIGDYWLGEVESGLGDEDFGEVRFGLGVGTFQNFARNTIESWVGNLAWKGYYETDQHYMQWGLKYQREEIRDQINEWERLDSAGYSLPYTGSQVLISEVLKSQVELSSNRYTGYVQDTWSILQGETGLTVTGGIRFNYWDLNNEFVVSPRVQLAYRPEWYKQDTIKRDLLFKFAIGMYNQPPFYRELRNQQGVVNRDVLAQKSIHAVLGADLGFKAFSRDFKFVTEVFYKHMYDLVPYEVENVRIRYFGDNLSNGYAAGIDLRLNGEFVEGADSWVSLSILKTEEDLANDGFFDADGNFIEPGLIARSTDQRLNFGMYFQDYMSRNKNFKVHLNLLFGTGLPFGPPENLRLKNAFRIPPYRRVDIGFSAQLLSQKEGKERENFFRHFKSIWASIEVFNLFGISNTVSYIWVKDTNNTVYAFPNFLTSRRLNARIIFNI